MSTTYTERVVDDKTLLDSITLTTTSDAMECAGAKTIALFLTKANTDSTLAGDLSITISPDGTNFYTYNMLIDNTTDSNSESLTRVASKSRNSDGTDVLWFTPETLGAILWFKAKVTVTNSGSGDFTVKALIQK